MRAAWTVIVATSLALTAGPAAAEEPLRDGWKKVVPVPSPLLGEGDRYVVWVERGWLQARRETAAGEIDWQVVLARATDPKPPTVSAPEGTFRFEASYRGGRFFVREDLNVLRCLRESKPDDPGAWPAVPFEAGRFRLVTGGPRLGQWYDEGWCFVAACPNKDRPDCLVRLAPITPGGTGYEGVKGSPLARVQSGKDWAIDDGDLLIAQRTLAAFSRAQLKPGDAAPPFAAKTLDGRPIALEDYRGKFVLLDFWATWCAPCIAEFPHLESIRKEFGKDERFAMIGLNLDDEVDAPRKFLAGKDLPWPQVFLGDPSESPVARDYNARSIPLTLLVGPDGKVVARGLRGEAIRAAVAKALGLP